LTAASPKLYADRMRYRLRTLLILLALGPPVLAGAWAVASRYISFGSDAEVFEGPSAIVHFDTACGFEPEGELQSDEP